MTAPSYAWVSIADSEWTANKALLRRRVRALRGNLEHARQRAYDPARHYPRKVHVHDGRDSERFLLPSGNLISSASMNDDTSGSWTKSGATFGADGGDAGMHAQTAGQYAYRALCETTSDVDGWFSTSGTTVVVSCFVKNDGAQTAGSLTFGLTTGTPPTFSTGVSASVAWHQLTTTYQRFYFVATTPTFSGNPRFAAYVASSFSSEIRVDCASVTLGDRLAPWHPSQGDRAHKFLVSISRNVPCFDINISLINAVKVTPS